MELKNNGMDLKNYFEILLGDATNPGCVTDLETKELVFANRVMKKMLQDTLNCSEDSLEHKTCYQTMFGETKRCSHCINHDLSEGKFQETYMFNQLLQRHYRVHNTLVHMNGRDYNLSKYFVTASYANQQTTYEEAMHQSMEIFSKNDFDQMTNDFLALLASFYQCEKAFIYYLNTEKTGFEPRFSWVSDPSLFVVQDLAQLLSTENILQWLSARNSFAMVAINQELEDTMKVPFAKELLEGFCQENLTVCVIEDEAKNPLGFVGVSNRAYKEFDYRLLKSVTRFIREGFSKHGMEDELKAISETDFLTGCFSRPKYMRTVEGLKTKCPSQLGVVFANINGLKKTNEYMGQSKGDAQIQKTADLLRTFFHEPFYRINGDEFLCFCMGDREDVFESKVNALHEHLKQQGDLPFALGHAWQQGKVDVEKLVAEADAVMYINKQEYYYSTHTTYLGAADSTLKDLLGFLANQEFLVYLQPQIDLKTKEVIGAEALIRRFDKENQKMVFPDEFIPLYEQKSVIRHVDVFVVNQVCHLLRQWGPGKQVPISVNLSRVTLMEFGIVDTLAKICDQHNVPHHLIVMEVTERIGIIENQVANTLIEEFHSAGFRVSLDDFGCAYSNIVTLAQITVDEVKIDKSLVDNLIESEKNRIILRSLVDMCHQFKDTHTLAEGIETQEQADILQEAGCELGQGYLYSRPIPSEEFFEKYIQKS